MFLENNTKLAIITTYDGSFDDYLNEFIDEIGDIFNGLLQYMKDAPPLPVQRNRDTFREYVKANDLGAIEPFYSAYPEIQPRWLDIRDRRCRTVLSRRDHWPSHIHGRRRGCI